MQVVTCAHIGTDRTDLNKSEQLERVNLANTAELDDLRRIG
jgi:hypothetical protein